MAAIEPGFVYGVIRKSLVLGTVLALATLFWVSSHFAVGVAVGVLVTSMNLRVVAWAIDKMLQAGREGNTSAGGWSLLLAGKMLFLIVFVWVLIAYYDVDAIGFVAGFSVFLPAIGLQMAVTPSSSEPGSDNGQG